MTPQGPARRTSGTRRDALARLALAEAYWERARYGSDDDQVERTARVGIACTAGIAFADAICLGAVGLRSAGGNHSDAIDLLRTVDADGARDLHVVITVKTQSQYGSTAVARDKAARVLRAVERLGLRARDI